MSTIPKTSDDTANGTGTEEHIRQGDWVATLTVLAIHKRFIFKCAGLCGLIGLAIAFIISNKYTSTTKILPPERVPSISSLFTQSGSASVASLALGASSGSLLKDPNDRYIGLIQSQPVLDQIIQEFNLQRVYSASNMTVARLKLQNATAIASGKDDLISISVEDRDRKRAAGIANAYVDGLRDLTKRLALTEASRRREFFQEQMDAAKDRLVAAESRLRTLQTKTGIVAMDTQAKATIDIAASLQEKIATKEVEIRGLEAFATKNNFELQMANKELNSLRAQLADVDRNSATGDPLDISVRALPQMQQELLDATREQKYEETVYDLLGRQLEAAKLDEAHEIPIIQTVEPAIPADRKSSPHRAKIVISFFLAGLFLSSFWIYTINLIAHASASRQQMFLKLKAALSVW